MRSWNRIGVIVAPRSQRCRYSDFPPGKVGNRKVWQSEESRKTLSGTRPGEQAGTLRRGARSTCIQILGKYPGYPRREETSWQHVLEIELPSMSMQLQRHLSLKTHRRNTRQRPRPSFLVRHKNISPGASRRGHKCAYFKIRHVVKQCSFFPSTRFYRQKERSLEAGRRETASYCFLFLLWLDIGTHGSKSRRWKSYYGESWGFLTSLCVSRGVSGESRDFWRARFVCGAARRRSLRIHSLEIDFRRDLARQRKFPRHVDARSTEVRKRKHDETGILARVRTVL